MAALGDISVQACTPTPEGEESMRVAVPTWPDVLVCTPRGASESGAAVSTHAAVWVA